MQTIIAQFANISQARAAVVDLLEHNYDRHDISFVASDAPSEASVGNESTTAAAGQASLGLLVGFGSLMIPYVGPLLAAGPLAVGLAGAATGVAEKDSHWLGSALGKYGVPEQSARTYGDTIQRGGAIILMGSRDEVTDNIVGILRDAGAVAINMHARDPKLSGA